MIPDAQLKPCNNELFAVGTFFCRCSENWPAISGMMLVFLDVFFTHSSMNSFCLLITSNFISAQLFSSSPVSQYLSLLCCVICFHKWKIPLSIFIRTIIIYTLVTSFALYTYVFNICRTCRFANKWIWYTRWWCWWCQREKSIATILYMVLWQDNEKKTHDKNSMDIAFFCISTLFLAWLKLYIVCLLSIGSQTILHRIYRENNEKAIEFIQCT